LEDVFLEDLNECDEITAEEWNRTSIIKRLAYACARLSSSFL
jgi:hypothetical protein